jgi:hypothetical protein
MTRPQTFVRPLGLVLMLVCVLALPFATHVRAQTGNWLAAHVDIPAPSVGNVAMVPYGSLYLAGWSFDCNTGTHPPALFVGMRRQSLPPPGGSMTWLPATTYVVGPIYRPDVTAAFGGACPSITDTSTGYAIYFSDQPPVGVWELTVAWANYSGLQTTQTMLVQIQ